MDIGKRIPREGNTQKTKGAKGMKKKTVRLSMVLLAGMLTLMVVPAVAMAAEGAGGSNSMRDFALAIGAGLGMGVAAVGCGLALGKATAAAMEGISRNPGASDKMFVPLIIGLALIEALVLYTWVVALFLQAKI